MFSFFKKKAVTIKPKLPNKLMLEEPEKTLFERALKFYIFIHQIPHKKLTKELSVQFKTMGNIVYSFFYNWLKDGKPSLDYLAFLNEKISELYKIDEKQLDQLTVKPREIDELELTEEAKFSFSDEETGNKIHLVYLSQQGLCKFSKID